MKVDVRQCRARAVDLRKCTNLQHAAMRRKKLI